MHRRHREKSKIVLVFIAICMCIIAPGCNIVGPAAYIIEGPPSVEAQHTLADVPTLVFIDDRSNVVNPVSLRRVIADKASEVLMVKKLLTTTISPQDAMTVARQRERNSNILSIEDIGKTVGAQQVIYVEMLQFQDTPDGFTPRPMAACRVRLIDVENRKRLFPPPDSQEASRLVQVMTREVDPSIYSTRSGRLQVFNILAEDIGEEVAKLFYKHERKELGGNLNPR
jgi:hypothetical protein